MTDAGSAIFPGSSEMAGRLGALSWDDTPLGPPAGWDPALRTLVPVLLASNQPMFLVWGAARTLIYNDGYAAILGRKHPQALGRDFLCVWNEIRADLDPIVAATYRGEPVQMDDIQLRMERNGYPEDTHFAFFYAPVRDASGAVAGFFCACTETTGQVQAAERVQLALEAGAIIGTWVWTVPDNRFIADERFAASFDLDPAMCQAGLPLEVVAESIYPEDWPRVEAALAEVVARGGPYRCEYRVRQRDGSYRWIEANGRVEMDAQGRPVRFPGVLLDIESRRRAEAERDQANALLRTFIEAVPGVVYAKDRSGRLIVANHGTAVLLGRPHQDFIGKTDLEVLADPEEAEAVMAVDRRVMESGIAEQLEEKIKLADGSAAVWWSTKAPLRDAEGSVVGLIGSSVDITDRKRAEDALRLSEQRAAIAMDVAQLGTWEWDVATGGVTADERARRMCGLPSGSAPLALAELRMHVHPDDVARVRQAFAQALEPGGDGVYAEEFRWLRPDGSIAWIVVRGVLTVIAASGASPRRAMLGSVLDVTERRQLVEALREADRRKDDFLAMLAHELRNPLAPISTAAQMLRLSGDPSIVGRASEIIGRQVGHLTRLVDDLLDVSRVTRGLVELDRQPVDLRSVVAAAAEQAKPLVQQRGHELRVALEAGRFTVEGDFHRLVQVVANLLNNASKYTPQSGRIEVRLGVEPGGAAGDSAGESVVVQVSDNGAGIPADLLPRVFDLFTQGERTPDRAQGGLGIGLALVRSMVQLHQGTIGASSPGPGQGSTFTIRLPRMRDGVPAERPGSHAPTASTQRHVLIVDDNVDAAATLAETLQLLGHRVATADGAQSALALAARGVPWDTVILDIGLPEMTGYELGHRLRRLPGGSSALLIALTGYGQAHDRASAREAGFDHHLVKPADIVRLAELLDHRPRAV